MSTPAHSMRNRLRWFGHKVATTAFVTEVLPGVAAKARAYAQLKSMIQRERAIA